MKTMIKKRMAVLGVLIALVMAIVSMGAFMAPAEAVSVSTLSASTHTPLFSPNGQINVPQAQNILLALGDLDNPDNIIDRETEFRLFPMAGSGYVLNLSRLYWRIVHVDGDRVTFWASGAYRTSQFHNVLLGGSSGQGSLSPDISFPMPEEQQPMQIERDRLPNTDMDFVIDGEMSQNAGGQYAPLYRDSLLRQNLLADFAVLTSLIPSLNNHILTQGTAEDGANLTDRIWIPSRAEYVIGGVWRSSLAAALFNSHGFHGSAWLRCHNTTAGSEHLARIITSTGTLSSVTATSIRSVRPALHISLESLRNAVFHGETDGGDVSDGDNTYGEYNDTDNDTDGDINDGQCEDGYYADEEESGGFGAFIGGLYPWQQIGGTVVIVLIVAGIASVLGIRLKKRR